jgi:polyisoprenoid-binding protein YceI
MPTRSRVAGIVAPALAILAVLAAVAVRAQEELPLELLRPGAAFRIHPQGSEVGWEVGATMHTVRSSTRAVSGEARVVGVRDDAWDLGGRLEIDAASFKTGNARRDRTLHETSLDVKKHPRIVFAPKALLRTSSWAEDERLAIEGDLTVRGVTKPLRFPVVVERQGARLVVEGATDLRWADFGVPDPSFLVVRLAPEVRVRARLELRPAS